MIQGFRDLDTILRGDATQLDAMGDGEIRLPGVRMLDTLVVLGLVYGLCMGSYALFRTYLSPEETAVGVSGAWGQLFASMVKVPLLFLLTLLVTAPSLYVFNALCGSRLRLSSMVKLLLAMLGVTLAVLAALGPIVAFFGVTSTSYVFMLLLNVVFFGAAGAIGLVFLLRTLHRLVTVQSELDDQRVRRERAAAQAPPPAPEPEERDDADEPGDGEVAEVAAASGYGGSTGTPPPPPPVTEAERQAAHLRKLGIVPTLGRTDAATDGRAKAVFAVWVILFGLVGAQMSWVLRPFVGSPDQPFSLFRDREGNFFGAVVNALFTLLGG